MNNGNLVECPDHDILTIEQERKLFKEYYNTSDKTKKEKIKQFIISHNIKFAIQAALMYRKKYSHVNMDDIKQYACLALSIAFDKYDHTDVGRFYSYASFWIKATINNSVHENEYLIRYPSNRLQKMEKDILNNDNEDSETYDIMLSNMLSKLSLNNVVSSNKEEIPQTYVDIIEDNNSLEHNIEMQSMASVVSSIIENNLSEKERQVIKYTYLTQIDDTSHTCKKLLSDMLNCSVEKVRQIELNAISKIRKHVIQLVAKQNLKLQDI